MSLEIATFKPVRSHILFTRNLCWSTFQVYQYTAQLKNKLGHEHDDRADKDRLKKTPYPFMPPTQSMTWEKNLRSLKLYRAYIALFNLT